MLNTNNYVFIFIFNKSFEKNILVKQSPKN